MTPALSVAAFVAQGLGVAIIEPFTARFHQNGGYVIRPLQQPIDFSFAELMPKTSAPSVNGGVKTGHGAAQKSASRAW